MAAFVNFPGRMMILRHFWEQIHTGNKFETKMNKHSFRQNIVLLGSMIKKKVHCRSSLSKSFSSEPVEAAAILRKVVVWSEGFPPKSPRFCSQQKTSWPYQILGILVHLLRMGAWNLNTLRLRGEYTPRAHHLTFGDWMFRDCDCWWTFQSPPKPSPVLMMKIAKTKHNEISFMSIGSLSFGDESINRNSCQLFFPCELFCFLNGHLAKCWAGHIKAAK